MRIRSLSQGEYTHGLFVYDGKVVGFPSTDHDHYRFSRQTLYTTPVFRDEKLYSYMEDNPYAETSQEGVFHGPGTSFKRTPRDPSIRCSLYKDMRHVKINGSYTLGPKIIGAPSDTITLTENGASLDSKFYERGCRQLCDAARLGLVSHNIDAGSLDFAEALFLKTDLPRQIKIDRDPFDTNFSIWYLLVDLIDLKKLFNKLLSSEVMRSRHTFQNGKYKHYTARDIADKNLGVQFGFIPTVRDIQDTVGLIQQWNERRKMIQEVLQKKFSFHTKRDFHDYLPAWSEDVFISVPDTDPSLGITVRVDSHTEALWHGQARYGFSAPDLQSWVSRLGQIVDSFGILDPAAIWDVIPFSFVIDWFFTTNQWFHNAKPRIFSADAILYDYLESVKIRTNIKYTAKYYSPAFAFEQDFPITSPASVYTEAEIGYEQYKVYSRHRFRPNERDVSLSSASYLDRLNTNPRVKGTFVNLNRVGISASLAAQRVPR